MFNWFKSKVELKNNNIIASSIHNRKGLKIGSEISVPENFECLVYYKGKCYKTLSSGKHKMDTSTFENLIKVQQKRKSKQKYIKCVCHFINKSCQKIEIQFKKQQFDVEFQIEDCVLFSNILLLYSYKVDNDYTLSTLCDIFHELILHYKGNYNEITKTNLSNYGILIHSFAPKNAKNSIFSMSTNQSQSTTNSNLQSSNTAPAKQVESSSQLQDSDSVKNSSNSNTSQFSQCPKCKHVAKFNTTYCLRCGHKLE